MYSASGRSEMAAKGPKLELPSLDELQAEKEQEKLVVSEVKSNLKVYKEAKVQNLSARSSGCWLHMVSK